MPTYGSATVFHTTTARGPVETADNSTSSPLGRFALTAGRSAGLGRYAIRASISGRTARLLTAEPQKTGTMAPLAMPPRRPRAISSEVNSSPSRYFMISSSSPSAAASTNLVRASSTAALMSAGISATVAASPMYAFSAITSTTPLNSEPSPIGRKTGTIVPPKTSRSSPTTRSNCAFSRSILLTNTARGSWRSSR